MTDKKIAYFLQLFGNLLSLITLVVVAKFFSASYFGEFSAKYSVYLIIYSISDYGLSAIGSRSYENQHQARSVIFNLLLIQFLICFLIITSYLIYCSFIDSSYDLLYSILAGLVAAITPSWVYSAHGSVTKFSIITTLQKFSILIIVLSGYGAQASVNSLFKYYFYVLLIFLIVNYVYIFLTGKVELRLNLKDAFLKTKHYYFQHVVGFVSNNIGQYVVYSHFGGMASGIYSMADKVSKPLAILATPFRNITVAKGTKRTVAFYENIVVFLGFAFWLISIIAVWSFSKSTFLAKFALDDLLVLSTLFILNNVILCLIEVNITINFYLKNNDHRLTRFSFWMSILSILLLVVLINPYKYYGAIVSMIVSNFILLLFVRRA